MTLYYYDIEDFKNEISLLRKPLVCASGVFRSQPPRAIPSEKAVKYSDNEISLVSAHKNKNEGKYIWTEQLTERVKKSL